MIFPNAALAILRGIVCSRNLITFAIPRMLCSTNKPSWPQMPRSTNSRISIEYYGPGRLSGSFVAYRINPTDFGSVPPSKGFRPLRVRRHIVPFAFFVLDSLLQHNSDW